ncbi:DUF4229 domain-containing protein [Humibacillus xanthopallidus]|uniref:DUF4229 domain-containing protein n=1 Tax=Humibacillus xanthopallidus TaxID=412689 RepID=UPI00384E3645
MARYTVLRLLIFFGFVFLFWIIGLRDNPVLLLAASAIASAALSYVLLRGIRDEMTAKLVERHEARLAAKAQLRGDEADEDAETSASLPPVTGTAGTVGAPGAPGSTSADAGLSSDSSGEDRRRTER